MSLNARAIALQGFGFGALQIGVQGLLVEQLTVDVGIPSQPMSTRQHRVRKDDLEEIMQLVKAALRWMNNRNTDHDPTVRID